MSSLSFGTGPNDHLLVQEQQQQQQQQLLVVQQRQLKQGPPQPIMPLVGNELVYSSRGRRLESQKGETLHYQKMMSIV